MCGLTLLVHDNNTFRSIYSTTTTFFFFFFGLFNVFPRWLWLFFKIWHTGTFSSLFLEILLFIYLAVSGLSCGLQDPLLWCSDPPVVVHGLFSQHVGSPTRDQPMSPASQAELLTSGPPGSPTAVVFVTKIEIKQSCFLGRFSQRAVSLTVLWILCLTSPWKAGEIENQHPECLTLFTLS